MKRLLVVMTPLVILALVLGTTGCEKKATPTPALTPSPTATATSAGKPEGELKIAVADLQEENPDIVFDSLGAKKYLILMYDYLVGANIDGTLSTQNGIAQKWEHSADYKTWTFYLREGIKFHNGDDITAEDVKFSLGRIGTTGTRLSFGAAIYANIQEVTVDSPYKLTVVLKNPAFFLDYQLSAMIGMEGMVLPKKYFEAKGGDYFRSNPIGSGPYRFVKQVVGQYITFEALDSHWSLGVPKYKTVTFYRAPEEITRIAMLKGGEADIIDVSREQAPGLQKAGFNLVYSPTGDYVTIGMHSYTGRSNPLSDERFRLALDLAIDKQALLDTLFKGQGQLISSSSIYPWVLGSVDLKPRPYDPERAKQLLAEAGYPDRFNPAELTIYSYPRAGLPEHGAMLEAIASYWMKVGIKVKIFPTDFSTYQAGWANKTLVNAVSGLHAEPQALSATSAAVSRSQPAGRFAYITDPPDSGYDALVDQLTAAKTIDEYTEVAKKITQYNYDHERNATIFLIKRPYAISQKVKEWNMGNLYYDINVRGLVKR